MQVLEEFPKVFHLDPERSGKPVQILRGSALSGAVPAALGGETSAGRGGSREISGGRGQRCLRGGGWEACIKRNLGGKTVRM